MVCGLKNLGIKPPEFTYRLVHMGICKSDFDLQALMVINDEGAHEIKLS